MVYYLVYVFDGLEPHTYVLSDKGQADLLFEMAVRSNMFEVICLRVVNSDGKIKKEWAKEV